MLLNSQKLEFPSGRRQHSQCNLPDRHPTHSIDKPSRTFGHKNAAKREQITNRDGLTNSVLTMKMRSTKCNATAVSLIILVLASHSAVFAQGIFLKRGDSRLGFQLGYATSGEATAFSAAVGYSIHGSIDLTFSLGRSSLDYNPKFGELNATSSSIVITLHFIKQNKNIPFSLSGHLGYQRDNFSGDVLDQDQAELSASSYPVGARLYHTISWGEKVSLIPELTLTYLSSTSSFTNPFVSDSRTTTNTKIWGIGLNFGRRNESHGTVFVSAGLTTSQGTTVFALATGYIF